ncbi:Imm50 family immunity protein [Citrobacter telavivensis]
MMSWTTYLVDSRYIDSIYHTDKPNLNEVDVHEVIFHRDGPKVSIILNLKEYPNAPPAKWVAQKFNTVQIKIALIDIEKVEMSGWIDTTYIACVDIKKTDGKINFNVIGVNLRLSVEAKFMDIESISAYMKK